MEFPSLEIAKKTLPIAATIKTIPAIARQNPPASFDQSTFVVKRYTIPAISATTLPKAIIASHTPSYFFSDFFIFVIELVFAPPAISSAAFSVALLRPFIATVISSMTKDKPIARYAISFTVSALSLFIKCDNAAIAAIIIPIVIPILKIELATELKSLPAVTEANVVSPTIIALIATTAVSTPDLLFFATHERRAIAPIIKNIDADKENKAFPILGISFIPLTA